MWCLQGCRCFCPVLIKHSRGYVSGAMHGWSCVSASLEQELNIIELNMMSMPD